MDEVAVAAQSATSPKITTSQKHTVLSPQAAARRAPSGLKASP